VPKRYRSRKRKPREKRRVSAVRSYRERTPDISLVNDLSHEEKEPKENKTIEEVLRDLRRSLDVYLPQVRDQTNAFREKAAKTARERPMLALGVAFLVGIALGITLSKLRD
jgi:ElaB/YqjD/DUF883 family membrane-anchored ribosome-binding protein